MKDKDDIMEEKHLKQKDPQSKNASRLSKQCVTDTIGLKLDVCGVFDLRITELCSP